MAMTEGNEKYVWSSSEGLILARKIIRKHVQYDPHDYQVEGVCKSLDGIHVIALTPTGSGKTGFFSMYMIVLLSVLRDPALCPTAQFSKAPLLLVICPTIALQYDMEKRMKEVSILKVIAINSETIEEARKRGEQDLWFRARTDESINIHLLGPEQLISKGFEDALRTNYRTRVCAYGIDELHLMNTWGAGFRKVYQQIGFLCKRLTDRSSLVGVSATGRAGGPMESICSFLGLQPGSFHLIRRSNIRNDVQILFRELKSGVNGFTFPELDWVLSEGRITLIFTTTINMTFRLFAYLYRLAPPGNRRSRIRMYHSLNWKSFNEETRALMDPEQGSRRCQIVIATASLSVGIDIPGFDDVLVVGEVPRDADDFVQKVGRVRPRKDAGQNARGILYVPRAAYTAAEMALVSTTQVKNTSAGGTMDLSIAQLLGPGCIIESQNEIYDNPLVDVPCSCYSCTENPPASRKNPCNCSHCQPEPSDLNQSATSVAEMKTSTANKGKHITKVMRTKGMASLAKFQRRMWTVADEHKYCLLPPEAFLPEKLMITILDNFFLILSVDDLVPHIRCCPYLDGHHIELFDVLIDLHSEFRAIEAGKKAENAAKAKAKRLAAKALKVSSATVERMQVEGGVVTEGNREGEDIGMDVDREPSDVPDIEEATREEPPVMPPPFSGITTRSRAKKHV